MQQKLKSLTQKLRTVILTYPLVLAMAAVMASTIVYMIENEHAIKNEFWPARVIIVSGLGISLLFALTMLAQRTGKQLWAALGIVILVGYYFILPQTEEQFTEVYVFLLVPTFVLSHLLVATAPFLGKQPEQNFWQYNKNLFVNLFLTVIFTGVLTGGVELAILAVDQLFSMKFDSKIYGDTFFILSIIGSVFIFLLFSGKGLEDLEQDSKYPIVLKFFTQFILIPLLLIYVVILYFYSGKILLKWQLPEGWVSYLVLAYSILGILALLLVHPLKGDSAKSWVKIFSKLFYFSLIPLLILLFTAIFTRVLEYGFTEPRYYVLLLAIWLLSVVLYFVFAKRTTIKFIPISLFLFGLFSLVFPFLNTFSVSRISQERELNRLLETNHLLNNGKIDFSKAVPYKAANDIDDKFRYLSKRFNKEYLSDLLDAKALKEMDGDRTWYIGYLFKNKIGQADNQNTVSSRVYSRNHVADIGDYQFVVQQQYLNGDGTKIGNDRLTSDVNMYGSEPKLMLKLNDRDSLDFMPLTKKLLMKYRGADKETDSLFVEGELGKYHVKAMF
ncbi:MAG: DUF4153 domain-containing protein, partial [Flavobacterium sp.]